MTPPVNYQDIASAAIQLKGEGKNVTIEKVRGILGTGSISTINHHLRKWKEAENAANSIANKENLPESFIALMKGLWENLITQAMEQFIPKEAAYQQEITELKSELEKYRANNQRWQKMFNQWQQEKVTLANEKLTLEQALDFAHQEKIAADAKQEALLNQSHEKQIRIDELNRLHQQTQANLEHYREAAREQRLLDQQKFEQEKQALLSEIKSLKETLIVKQQQLTSIQESNIKLSEASQLLEKNVLQSQQESEMLKQENLNLEKHYHDFQIKSQSYENHNQQMQTLIQDQAAQLIHHQAENKMLAKQLADILEESTLSKDQLKLLSQEKWELSQEKAMLEGQVKQMQKMVAV